MIIITVFLLRVLYFMIVNIITIISSFWLPLVSSNDLWYSIFSFIMIKFIIIIILCVIRS